MDVRVRWEREGLQETTRHGTVEFGQEFCENYILQVSLPFLSQRTDISSCVSAVLFVSCYSRAGIVVLMLSVICQWVMYGFIDTGHMSGAE